MLAIIFIGIQGTGKSTFYKENFFNTHLRISLDLLNTRNKENALIEYALQFQQRVVIDNTNPSKQDRQRYIKRFQERKYEIIGYYFKSSIKEALQRNSQRSPKKIVPEAGVRATLNKLELPSLNEGFDKLYYVKIQNNQFIVNPWKDEV